MKKVLGRKKQVQKYSADEIVDAIRAIWDRGASNDSWGIPVMYLQSLISHLRRSLPKSKKK